jgi:nucleotide-binding universal stress UspA family protein
MFKKILLPVDLSDRHERALETAMGLAASSGAEVVLLHVIEVIAGLPLEEEKSFYLRLEKAARKHLSQLGERLAGRHLPWRMEITYGTRGREIVRYAGEAGADLVVLTAPRVDLDGVTTGWGSLSYKVGFFTPCPVLLVK